MKRKNLTIAIVFLAALTAAVACKKEAPPAPAPVAVPAAPAAVSVADITLGSSLNADKTVVAVGTTFKSTDTIYASVKTNGTSSGATLAAKWTYQDGQTIHDESVSIAPTGPTVTEFHINKVDGWPTGKYKVEISLNGAVAGSRELEVK
ncbi:MAG: hypothetical protein ABI609_12430 [Acidobacteriota bacterium]